MTDGIAKLQDAQLAVSSNGTMNGPCNAPDT